jgi:hypothetical protein
MHSRYIFRLFGVGCVITVAALILTNGRHYLLAWFGISIPGNIYGSVAVPLFLFVAFSSARPVIGLLKARARPERSFDRPISDRNDVEKTYRYPLRFRFLSVCFGTLWICLPYLTSAPDLPITGATYLICFGAAALSMIGIVYLFRYRVTIRENGFVIRSFGTHKISFDEITSFRVSTPVSVPPAGRRAVALLTDGEEIIFYRALVGFDDLVRTLTSRISKNALNDR